LLGACSSVRPIVKIGLIAPFEGLYRQSGYAALDAMRQAMAECAPPGIDVLPLALDDSGDPARAQRAAQKLLIDPTVRAIVGPLLITSIPAVAGVITSTSTMPWFVPSLVAPMGGFGDSAASAWLEAQVDYIAVDASAARVLLLGLPTKAHFSINTAVPTLRVDNLDVALTTIAEGDALLWLGKPDEGARWLIALRQAKTNIDFWLAEQAGIDVFAAHVAAPVATGTVDYDRNRKKIHWLLWTNSDYNQWLQSGNSASQPGDAMRYLTYRATCDALATLEEKQALHPPWQLQSQPLE
jgi:branched-chain amino acid transport system substrate-binding protein